MKKITAFTILAALLLTASLASAQMMGGGFGSSQTFIPTNTATNANTSFSWPMFGFGTQAGVQAGTANQATTAQGNLWSLMPMLQFFGASR